MCVRGGYGLCEEGSVGCTHVDEVGQVVDVVLEHAAVGGLQHQEVLIPGLDGLQPVLSVFGLSLRMRQSRLLKH